ncbi:hypothetical protein Tco_1391736 [Tanacetum coccineum]
MLEERDLPATPQEGLFEAPLFDEDSAYKHPRYYIAPEARKGRKIASTEARGRDMTLYVEAAGGANRRNRIKSLRMERETVKKINKPDCDTNSEDGDGGFAHQDPNTSHLEADARVVDDHYTGTITDIETDDTGRFKMCFIGFGVAIKSFLCYMRPLIIIDAAHLKWTYLGTNLVTIGMDGNSHIILIATCVSQDRNYAITLACNTVFPNLFHGYCRRHLMMNCGMQSDKFKELYWKTCKAYKHEDFEKLMSDIHAVRPDAHQKLVDAGIEKWSREKCPANRYNYMTSNSVESINALTKNNMVRKKLKSTQQKESSQGNNYWNESQQEANHDVYQQCEMYEPQHVTNYMEDMYHPNHEYTDQYFMYQHNP